MKKKLMMIMAALLALMPLGALADVDIALFDQAKSALSYISYGEYAKALKMMGLSSDGDDVKRLKAAVGSGLSTALYGEVQTVVAVYYASEKGYRLCVPVEDPSVGGVEALVMLSQDGRVFDGYQTAMWTDCTRDAALSGEVVWCDPVTVADPLIIAD